MREDQQRDDLPDPAPPQPQGPPAGWDPSTWRPGMPWFPGVAYPNQPGWITGQAPGQMNAPPGGVQPGQSVTFPGPNGTVTQTGGTNGDPGTITANPPPQPAAAPPPPGPGGNGGGGSPNPGTLGSLLTQPATSYTPLAGTPTSWQPIGAPPTYTAVPFPNIPAFQAPTQAQAQQDPGYQFAAQQGEQALQQSQAAQGLANTGGSLKDILAWGQNYAAQRYSDVYNRAAQTYNTNTQTQYVDPWQANSQNAWNTYQSQLAPWQTQAGITNQQNQFLTNANFQSWLSQWQNFKDQRNWASGFTSQ